MESQITSLTEDCLEQTLQEGIQQINLQGGYYGIPNKNLVHVSLLKEANQNLTSFYSNSIITIPNQAKVKSGLSNYLEDNIDNCLNFSEFENAPTTISKTNLKSVTSIIKENQIKAIMDYPIEINRENKRTIIREFSSQVVSNIDKFLEVSGEIVNIHRDDPRVFCINCFEIIAKKNNVKITSTNILVSNNTYLMFHLEDRDLELNNEFVFLIEK